MQLKLKTYTTLTATVLLFSIFLSGCQKRFRPGEPINSNLLKIGIIFNDDAQTGYHYAHDMGLRFAVKELSLDEKQIIRKYNLLEGDPMLIEAAIRDSIAEGANIIIAPSFDHGQVCEKLAPNFPGVIFLHASGNGRNDTNFTNYFGRIYQARYISGVVAGLQTKTGRIGYVAAMDKRNSEVTGGLNAFAIGVESVNPDAKVYVRVVNNWADVEREAADAKRLVQEGCDVLTHHTDSSAINTEAEKAGVWSIGYNSDMSREAPGAVLTSVVWNWGVYYKHIIRAIIDGRFNTEPYFGGISEGFVDITPFNPAVAVDGRVRDAVESAKNRIKAGYNVFDGELRTNEGAVIGSVGGTLSDNEIKQGINWYYHNVEEIK